MNILTFHTHESYQYELAKTRHNFYNLLSEERPNGWNSAVRPKPKNIFEISHENLNLKDFDILLTQSQGQNLKFRGNNTIKKINLEHTFPMTNDLIINVEADAKVYITESSKKMWRDPSGVVIRHGIDYREWPECRYSIDSVLTTVHAFKRRDWACGYELFKNSTSGINSKVFGSENEDIGAEQEKSYEHLKEIKSKYSIYFNTSLRSPVPFALLEAMASGMIIVSTSTCEIPYYIKNGHNGILHNHYEFFNKILDNILKNKNKHIHLGKKARSDIKRTASSDVFLSKWDMLFKKTIF